MMNSIFTHLINVHREKFHGADEVRLFSCPGRINLIGEHIDYNGGKVLPAAMNKAIFLCISPNSRQLLRCYDHGYHQYTELSLELIQQSNCVIDQLWTYTCGAFRILGNRISTGFDLSYYSTIPTGAGVSSSAAISIVTLYALMRISGMNIDTIELARIGQRIERDYAGVSCGIMDQFAVIHGKRDNAVLLDTRDLNHSYLPINSSLVHFILVNSGIKHNLRDSEYNVRRNQCENALKILQRNGFPISFLCDMKSSDLLKCKGLLPDIEFKRALHAVTENERTMKFHDSMIKTDIVAGGAILYDSHSSLSDLFEVSIPEMDRMVAWTRDMEGICGSRMMGGGFGGCTITMVQSPRVGSFIDVMKSRFRESFGREPEIIDCTLEDGVRELEPDQISTPNTV